MLPLPLVEIRLAKVLDAQVTVRIHRQRIVIWHDAERLAEHPVRQTEHIIGSSIRRTLHRCSDGSRVAR